MKIRRFVFCPTLAAILCFSAPSAANGQGHIGPSNSTIAGGIAGIGAGVAGIFIAVAVVHSHHVLTGCVVAATNGTELRTNDAKTWSLEGDSASISPGHRVKVHGSRASHRKASSSTDVFTVDKLVKDYGACEVNRADSSRPAH